jgi:hypothetical protein
VAAALSVALATLLAAGCAAVAPPAPADPVLQSLGQGLWLLPGRFPRDRQPDGNSIVIEAPAGLAVVDTGRHADHAQALLDFAARKGRPIAAVATTHWHLDHLGGNARLREVFPRPGSPPPAAAPTRSAFTPVPAARVRQPVEFVVPAGTGGGADQMARFIQGVVAKNKLMKPADHRRQQVGGAGAEGFLDVKGDKGNPHKIVITLSQPVHHAAGHRRALQLARPDAGADAGARPVRAVGQ